MCLGHKLKAKEGSRSLVSKYWVSRAMVQKMRVREGKGQNPLLVPQPGGDGYFISAMMIMLFLLCCLSQNRSLGPCLWALKPSF